MCTLVPASESYKKSKEFAENEAFYKREYVSIATQINDATESGMFQLLLSETTLSERIINRLKSLGYEIELLREYPYCKSIIKISWVSADDIGCIRGGNI